MKAGIKKKGLWIVGLTLLLTLVGCSGAGRMPEPLTPEEVNTRNEQNEITIVDVRGPEAYAEGHIPSAINIPTGELDERVGEIPEGKQLILVCQGGPISRRDLETVRDAGFEDANNMEGGMSAWEDKGYPLEPSSP
jgi:rhodanese-related sulfurtransferase